MVKIISENKKPSLGQRFSNAVGVGLEQGQKLYNQYQEKKTLKEMGLEHLANLSPETKKEFIKQFAKSSAQEQLLQRAFPGKFGGTSPSTTQNTAQQLQGKNVEETDPRIQESPSNENEFDVSDFTPQERVKMSLINPNVSKQLTEEDKLQFKKDVHQQGLIDKSYDIHKPYIDDITNAHKGFETETKPRLLQMQALNDEQLIGPTAAKFLETMGIPLGSLENPSSEVFSKLSQDLLKGLPETYGNRILKVEVDNFLKTIPTLLNSPEGRRMIASNMLKLGQLRETFYKEMRRQQVDLLDKNKKFPKDFEQRVFDNVQPHLNKLNNQFVKMSEIKAVPPGTVPFFGPTGEISFVPKNAVEWAEKNGGERIW